MREIEFRGKDIKTNEWVYGGYYKHLKRTPSPIGNDIKDEDYQHLIINSGFSDWNMPKPLNCYEVDENTVGQYTGLKDKNGKKIYEGDIDNYGYLVTYVADIKESLGMHCGWYLQRNNFESWCELICNNNIEIIGNIYDNPELAK